MKKTILITGVSSGFGQALAKAALAEGHTVVGTVRKEEHAKAFEALKPSDAHARLLDVTDTAAIAPMVADIENNIGAIDALVNNAGYGHEGIIEETPLDEVRHQFEVNVFGPVALIQAVLPYMRKRRTGHILNITSMGGFITMPGLGVYHGSKFALEGLSETLGKEVRDLGIFVTAIEPGSFRTEWAGRSLARVERSIPDYDAVFNPGRERRQGYSGKQPGSPDKAAEAMLKVIASQNPPARLLLGPDANRLVNEKLESWASEREAWMDVTLSTDF